MLETMATAEMAIVAMASKIAARTVSLALRDSITSRSAVSTITSVNGLRLITAGPVAPSVRRATLIISCRAINSGLSLITLPWLTIPGFGADDGLYSTERIVCISA